MGLEDRRQSLSKDELSEERSASVANINGKELKSGRYLGVQKEMDAKI